MGTLKASEVERFAKNPPANISAVLVYGPNEGRVAEISSRIVKSVLGSLDDPFNLVFLNEDQLKEHGGILQDEMLAMSFTGGRKVVWVKNPATAFMRQFPALLNGPASDNLLVVQTGSLKKTSALRKTFEKEKTVTCIACYEDTQRDLSELVNAMVKVEDKSIEPEAINQLIELAGTNRLMLVSEVEKLLLFCAEQQNITIKDIWTLSNDPVSGTLDELLDKALLGDLTACASRYRQLVNSGVQPAQILSMLSSQLVKLQRFRIDIDKGMNPDMVLRSARPPIFFKKQPIVKRQLLIWESQTIEKAQTIIFDAILLTRQNTALAESIGERALISLSRFTRHYSR